MVRYHQKSAPGGDPFSSGDPETEVDPYRDPE